MKRKNKFNKKKFVSTVAKLKNRKSKPKKKHKPITKYQELLMEEILELLYDYNSSFYPRARVLDEREEGKVQGLLKALTISRKTQK